MRKTVVFGNGLGMALDPEHFTLASAFSTIWNEESLDDISKKMLLQCIGQKDDTPPQSEDELLRLHSFLKSFTDLKSFETTEIEILQDKVRNFDVAVKKYFTKVAMYFHGHDVKISDEFKANFALFVRHNSAHVATLSYDDLVSQMILDESLHVDDLGSSYGPTFTLVDGFCGTPLKFSERNLVRLYDSSNHSWFMHLHGSPLYVQNGSQVNKLKKSEIDETLSQDPEVLGSNIVLQHFDVKAEIITQSNLLASYWTYFNRALSESNEVVFFGYSGFDKHLNILIDIFLGRDGTTVKVVEWSGSKNSKEYWKGKLKNGTDENIEHVPLDSIMEFEWN